MHQTLYTVDGLKIYKNRVLNEVSSNLSATSTQGRKKGKKKSKIEVIFLSIRYCNSGPTTPSIHYLRWIRLKREREMVKELTAMMSQTSRGACSAFRMSRMSEASLGSWSRETLTSSSEFWTGMYTHAMQRDFDSPRTKCNNRWISGRRRRKP